VALLALSETLAVVASLKARKAHRRAWTVEKRLIRREGTDDVLDIRVALWCRDLAVSFATTADHAATTARRRVGRPVIKKAA
jgi:hypothetical protein